MKLGTKIIISFVCISLLLAVIGVISDLFTEQVRQNQLQYVNEASEVVIYTGEMERSLYQSVIYLNAVRETREIQSDSQTTTLDLPVARDMIQSFYGELENFEITFDELKTILGESEDLPEDVSELEKRYNVYKSISTEWLELEEEDFDEANLMFISSIEPYFRNNIIPKITELRWYTLLIQRERTQALNQTLQRAAIANYVATFISILIAVALAVYIYRSIANPLAKFNESAKQIGQGKLDERIEINSKDELGELADAFNEMVENLENKTVSKAFLDNIIESIQEALFVTDTEGVLKIVNSAAGHLLGYRKEQMIGRPVRDFYDLEEMGEVYEENSHKNRAFEFSLLTSSGEKIPVLFSEADLLDSQGTLIGTATVASDISVRKQQEQKLRSSLKEKEVLLAEIHHRVKNNLAVISGLLQLQSFSARNEIVEKALSDSQLRIQSIALVHEMLYQSESLAYIEYDKYVNDLLQAISSMHMNEEKDIKLVSEVESVSLSINQAIPCSLLLNELIVNSFKHAFNGSSTGIIKVELFAEGDMINLTVSDNGKGFDIEKFENSDSLGSTLIKTLNTQLNGKFKVLKNEEKEDGSVFSVSFKKEE